MTINEANKICAEFMGNTDPIPSNIDELSDKQKRVYLPYMHSLDSLIPIWEKLNQFPNIYRYKSHYQVSMAILGRYVVREILTEACVLATAKAIKELKK